LGSPGASAQTRALFLALVAAQAAHSVEEYVFRLWDVFAPARYVAGLAGIDPRLGFAVANTAIAVFGIWCYLARVRPGGPSAWRWAGGWAAVEAANGIAHVLLALRAGGYFPGLATAPLLLGLATGLGVLLIWPRYKPARRG
jgi:hypothetical protein